MSTTDDFYSDYHRKLETDLDSLTNKYAELRRTVQNRYADVKKLASDVETNDRHRLYPIRVAACIAVFVATFSISLFFTPMLPYKVSDPYQLSGIIGIAAGTIMAIIFIVDDNLKTQRLNEKLAAKSYEIKIQRGKILSYLQRKRQQV
jgi:hypothetical protein